MYHLPTKIYLLYWSDFLLLIKKTGFYYPVWFIIFESYHQKSFLFLDFEEICYLLLHTLQQAEKLL